MSRPKSFKCPCLRINVMLPATMVKTIRETALDSGQTPGQVIAGLLQILAMMKEQP